ncbi:hypothetical protein Sjap_005035 [Stephania japonica]|uniref:Uncharacterized protein n=1 Tax=Stephania japonica TaxID=461633 RepID=A0AAP0PIC8_9MAGN
MIDLAIYINPRASIHMSVLLHARHKNPNHTNIKKKNVIDLFSYDISSRNPSRRHKSK